MTFFTILLLIGIALYTLGFAVTLWKENKLGSIAMFCLLLLIVGLPYFTVFA